MARSAYSPCKWIFPIMEIFHRTYPTNKAKPRGSAKSKKFDIECTMLLALKSQGLITACHYKGQLLFMPSAKSHFCGRSDDFVKEQLSTKVVADFVSQGLIQRRATGAGDHMWWPTRKGYRQGLGSSTIPANAVIERFSLIKYLPVAPTPSEVLGCKVIAFNRVFGRLDGGKR